MHVSDLLTIAIVVVVLVVRIFGRLRAQQVQPRRAIVMPLVLTVVGATQIASHAKGKPAVHLTHTDITWLVIAIAVSLLCGVVRGLTVKLSVRDGELFQQYRAVTVVLWFATIAVRLGVDVLAHHSGAGSAVTSNALLMMFGISLGGESLTVLGRAVTGGLPLPGQGSGRGGQFGDGRRDDTEFAGRR
jgi:membrane protein CcdC involved in cytochrome C biogenesis